MQVAKLHIGNSKHVVLIKSSSISKVMMKKCFSYFSISLATLRSVYKRKNLLCFKDNSFYRKPVKKTKYKVLLRLQSPTSTDFLLLHIVQSIKMYVLCLLCRERTIFWIGCYQCSSTFNFFQA